MHFDALHLSARSGKQFILRPALTLLPLLLQVVSPEWRVEVRVEDNVLPHVCDRRLQIGSGNSSVWSSDSNELGTKLFSLVFRGYLIIMIHESFMDHEPWLSILENVNGAKWRKRLTMEEAAMAEEEEDDGMNSIGTNWTRPLDHAWKQHFWIAT